MARSETSRLIEPSPLLATLLEAVVEKFFVWLQERAQQEPGGDLEKLSRYQDAPVWLIRQRIARPEKIVYASLQVACWQTAAGQEIAVTPLVWVDLGKQGTLVQPSIPPGNTRRVQMPLLVRPAEGEASVEERLERALFEAWGAAQAQASQPEHHATKHVQPQVRGQG